MRILLDLPLFLLLLGVSAVSMAVPSGVAFWMRDYHDARSFFYAGLIGLILTTLIGLALGGRGRNKTVLSQLSGLLGGMAFLPVFLAVPFHEAVQTTTFVNAYFEMVSSLTTTGATLFSPDRLSAAEHLWRAQVGWMGGLAMWVAAGAIMAPLTLGGFEVAATTVPGQGHLDATGRGDRMLPPQRLWRSAKALTPVYAGLTLVLWVLLMVAGETPLVGVSHAMSVLATSGISPVGGMSGASSGVVGEMLLFAFMLFSLSRLTFSTDTMNFDRPGLLYDPEFRLGVLTVLGATLMLMLRHWIAAFEVNEEENLFALLRAFWGAIFTVLSFLSTTGFESANWGAAQAWSGLKTPGLIFIGLAIMGGGVATTAGGVKLLRVFALYLNGAREIQKLVHPSSVGRSGGYSRQIRAEGTFISWVFFMLFAISLAAYTVALGAMNVPFDKSIVLAVASLTNTGPLAAMEGELSVDLPALGWQAKIVLSSAMVLGRLELLAIIALLSPSAWWD